MESLSLIIMCLQACWTFSPVSGTNPVMTQASMDVGNIISIVIPESPDANINIDQLTSDFRRQLERIRQQSRVNKLEHGLVTLKNVIPSMSREEKKKTMPLIRRMLQGKRSYRQPRPESKDNPRLQKKHTVRTTRRHSSSPGLSKKDSRYRKNTLTRPVKPDKYQKNPRAFITRQEEYFQARVDDELSHWNPMERRYPSSAVQQGSWSQSKWRDSSRPKSGEVSSDCRKAGPRCQKDPANEITQIDPSSLLPISPKSQRASELLWIQPDSYQQQQQQQQQKSPPKEFPCSEGDNEYKVRNAKDVRMNEFEKDISSNDCTREIDVDGQIYSSCNNDSATNSPEIVRTDYETGEVKESVVNGTFNSEREQMVYPINIEVEDFKGIERILQNPQDALEHLNASGFDNDVRMDENALRRRNAQVNENLENAAILTSMNQEDSQLSMVDDSKDPPNFNEFSERNRDLTSNGKQLALASDRIAYQNNMHNPPKVTHQLNFDDENIEIRIQRSVDDNLLLKKSIKSHVPERSSEIKLEPMTGDLKMMQVKPMKKKKKKKKTMKMKKSWKMYPLNKQPLLRLEKRMVELQRI